MLYLHYDQILCRPLGIYMTVPYPETLYYSEILMWWYNWKYSHIVLFFFTDSKKESSGTEGGKASKKGKSSGSQVKRRRKEIKKLEFITVHYFALPVGQKCTPSQPDRHLWGRFSGEFHFLLLCSPAESRPRASWIGLYGCHTVLLNCLSELGSKFFNYTYGFILKTHNIGMWLQLWNLCF